MADPEADPVGAPDDEPPPTEEAADKGDDTGGGVEVVETSFRSSDVPAVTLPKDHFTLSHPTTTIRYRRSTNAARIIEDADKQYILEEADEDNGEHEITIRQLQDTSEGVRFLRITYALATAFWTGFFFIFCVQILLFVFLDLAIQFGITSGDKISYGAGLGIMFSIFPFIHGLASGLVIAGVFVADTGRGHPLLATFSFDKVNRMVVEWIYFFFFLGLPSLGLCFSLLSGSDDFWAITSLIWFCSVLVFFFVFAYNVIFYEIKSAFEVIKNKYDIPAKSWLEVVKKAIYLRQVATYGGHKTITVVSMGRLRNSENTDDVDETMEVPGTRRTDISWRARLTAYQGFLQANMYQVLPDPEKVFTVDDARDVRPFLTRYTWSLEKVFCRPKKSRYVVIVSGPGALTRSQMKSSVACSVIGCGIIMLLIISLFVYMKAPAAATLFGIVVSVFIAAPHLKSTFRLWLISKEFVYLRTACHDDKADEKSERSVPFTMKAEGDTVIRDQESEGLYITSERYRVTKPTEWFAFTMFGIESFFLMFWPVISYFSIGNWPIGMLYLFTVGVSGARYYVNAALVLEEEGDMKYVKGNSEKEVWTNRARLDDIVGNVSRGRSKKVWNNLLGLLGLAFLALFVGTVGSGLEDINEDFGSDNAYVSPGLFQYEQEDALRYPTCTLTSDLGDSPLLNMADYAFMAGHGYRGVDDSQEELDLYFEGAVIDRQDIVDEYRFNVTDSRVSFKLLTATTTTGEEFAYISIRGTVTPWDAMTDAQLWAPAALLQFLRLLLPFGDMWTPVLPYLISSITYVESEAINQISFYRDTVAFTEWLRDRDEYKGIAITGHSLGGGLAMITGAITKLPSVGLSGPNAVLSRRSFDPMISREALDKYTFNIVPERDVVPMLDDKAQNSQTIRCNADFSDVVGCHSPLRAICEIHFTCGSLGRPVICECVEMLDFPKPKAVGNNTIDFDQACADARAQREAASGGARY